MNRGKQNNELIVPTPINAGLIKNFEFHGLSTEDNQIVLKPFGITTTAVHSRNISGCYNSNQFSNLKSETLASKH